jgi:hypothetical protein
MEGCAMTQKSLGHGLNTDGTRTEFGRVNLSPVALPSCFRAIRNIRGSPVRSVPVFYPYAIAFLSRFYPLSISFLSHFYIIFQNALT